MCIRLTQKLDLLLFSSPDLLSPSKASLSRLPPVAGLLERENQVIDPWGSLFRLLLLVGQRLGWEFEPDIFSKPKYLLVFLFGVGCLCVTVFLAHLLFVPIFSFLTVMQLLFVAKGRLGMSDIFPLSGISGLSLNSTLLSPLLFFCLLPLLFLFSFSAYWSILLTFVQKALKCCLLRDMFFFLLLVWLLFST